MKRILVIVAISSLVCCNFINNAKSQFAKSQHVSDDILKQTGYKAFVSFNWNNGKLTNLNISVDESIFNIPDVKSTTFKIVDIIKSNYQELPVNTRITFVVPVDHAKEIKDIK